MASAQWPDDEESGVDHTPEGPQDGERNKFFVCTADTWWWVESEMAAGVWSRDRRGDIWLEVGMSGSQLVIH